MPYNVSSYLRNPNSKSNLTNLIFKMCVIQIRRCLRYNQVIYFANNDGTIDIVTTHSMELLQWTNDHEETAAKMFVLVKHIVDEHQI